MPSWLVPHSFRVQITIVAAASLAVVALAVLLIRDVVGATESRLLAEARRQCEAACRELVRQHQERVAWGNDRLATQPLEVQDLPLRGVAATVLRSYPGLEGGYYSTREGRIFGHAAASGEPAQLSARELEMIRGAAERAGREPAWVTVPWEHDLVVAVVLGLEHAEGVAWALRRLTGARDPAGRSRRIFYGGLAVSAALGVGAVVWLWFALHARVGQISAGLRRLQEDFSYRLPGIPGEFGEITRAVNQMAERRMALEAELRRQDRLAALGKVVAGVAHEIRNPLNSIRLTLELLERRLRKNAATGDEVRAAMREIDRLDSILARLLAFGRPHLAERRLQPLRPLIEQAVGIVAEQARRKGVQIKVQLGPGEIWADVDGPQIIQVLINLLLNAIEASPPGGDVEVRARASEERALIGVTDYGAGIPEPVRPHIFDAFFTTRPEGSGLGLSVSREIAVAHGGELEYDPAGPGTTFRLVLPGSGKPS